MAQHVENIFCRTLSTPYLRHLYFRMLPGGYEIRIMKTTPVFSIGFHPKSVMFGSGIDALHFLSTEIPQKFQPHQNIS